MTDQARDEGGGAGERDDAPYAFSRVRRPSWRHSWRARRTLRAASRLSLGVILAISVAIGSFFLALSRGPITFDWLAPKLIESLNEQFGRRYEFALERASIANTGHGPTLSVDGLAVKLDGRVILAAPRAEMSVDLRSLVLGGVRPRRIEALDLELRLSVMPDGTMAVSAGAGAVEGIPLTSPLTAPAGRAAAPDGTPAQAPIQSPIARTALLREAAGMLRGLMDLATSPDSAIGALDRLGVSHGRLVIDDRTVDRVISYDDLTLTLDKGSGGMRFSLAATGGARRWTAVATAKGAPGARREFEAQMRGLSIDEIALVGGFRNLKFDTDAPISIDWRFALGEDDRLLEAKGRFELGAGFFRLEEPDHEPVMIDAIAGDVRWDKEARRFVIAPFAFKAGGFDMALTGTAAAPKAAGGGDASGADASNADAWDVSLRLDRPTLVMPERASEKGVIIEQGALETRFLHGDKKLVFDKFEFAGPDVNASFAGAMSWANGPHIDYSLTLVDTQIRALTRLWPTHVAAGVRSWFLDHVTTGVIRRATYGANFDQAALTAMRHERSPPDNSVNADFEIANGTLVDIVPGMPPLSGVSGRARVTGRTASFAAAAGSMETAPGRRLTVSEGRFSVADNMIYPMPVVLDLRLGGGVEGVADLLAIPSIASYANLPMDPSVIKGQIEGRVRVDFEMGTGARPERTVLAVDASTNNLSIDRFAGKERLENAALNIVSDRAGLRVNGSGKLYGVPAALELRRPPGDKGAAQALLTLTFDEAARQKAGYVLPGVSGPVAASIKTPLPVADVDTRIELDLTRTALDNPLPGLVKPAGKPAKASFVLARRAEGMVLEQLQLDAGAAHAQGVVELSRDGAFRAARLTQARLSPGDDVRVDVQRGGEALKVVESGSNFDARPILRALTQPAAERAGGGGGKASGSFEDFDLELKSPIVTGHGKQILANADLRMEKRGGRLRAFSLTGNFGREQLAVAMARNQNGAPQLEISTNDGGSFLSFMDFYQKMDNGVLKASVLLGERRADGELHIRDFILKHEPTMRQLMAQGGVERAERGGVRFDPDAVRVGHLQAAFGWAAGRLSLREGAMSGPEIGMTFDGFIDFTRDQLDLGGSYVPAYALNSLLSNIPVLNVFITGGQNEGIFALNYRMTGAIGSPAVVVNPLSVIAPGLMRKFMGVIDGSVRPPDAGR